MKLGFLEWIGKTITQKITNVLKAPFNSVLSTLRGLGINISQESAARTYDQTVGENYARELSSALPIDARPDEIPTVSESWERNYGYKAYFDITRYNPLTGKNEKGMASMYFDHKPSLSEMDEEMTRYQKSGYLSDKGVMVEMSFAFLAVNSRLFL